MVLVVKMELMNRSVEQDKELAVLDQMMAALKKHQSVLSGDIVNAPLTNLGILNVVLDLIQIMGTNQWMLIILLQMT